MREGPVAGTEVVRRALVAGTAGGLAMIPVGLALRFGLDQRVNVYGELVVQTLLGQVSPWALLLQHALVSWVLALPLALARMEASSVPALATGLAYGAGLWLVINSLSLPLLFGRPTPWQLGWSAVWPSLIVHLVYGAAAAWVSRVRHPRAGSAPEQLA